MIEKEKRKPEPELKPSWFRTTGCLFMLIAVGIWGSVLFIPNSVRADLKVFVPFFCGLFTFMAGLGFFMRYTASGKLRPGLHQIRQKPDYPLIVQQWNGQEWVDRLDLRSAVNDAQESDSSQR